MTQPKEPLLNIPPLTLGVGVLLLAAFFAMNHLNRADQLIAHAVFIPAELSLGTTYTLLSYGLLHFGWAHIAMNSFGILAFGSAIERLLGKMLYMLIFLGGIICGALGHWLIFSDSIIPLGGASAGVSALFGAMLPFMVRKPQLLSVNVIFILTNIVFGVMGVAGSAERVEIAWQAHIFGFVYGELLGAFLIKQKISRLKRRDIGEILNPQA